MYMVIGEQHIARLPYNAAGEDESVFTRVSLV